MAAVTVGVLTVLAGVFLLVSVNALLGALVVVLGVLTIGSAVREWHGKRGPAVSGGLRSPDEATNQRTTVSGKIAPPAKRSSR